MVKDIDERLINIKSNYPHNFFELIRGMLMVDPEKRTSGEELLKILNDFKIEELTRNKHMTQNFGNTIAAPQVYLKK